MTSLMLHLLCQTGLCALHNIVPQTFQRVQTMIIRKVERRTIVAKAKKPCLFFMNFLRFSSFINIVMMMMMTTTMRFLLLGGLSIEPFMQHHKWNNPKDMELCSLGCDV